MAMQDAFQGGEELIVRTCGKTGLHAIISIDSTAIGPAAGGCRRWQYVDEAAAIRDAQRLSQGMTFKNALAGIPFGGGKSVIMAADRTPPTTAQLQTFARWMNELNGRYVTAEDVGMGLEQMRIMCEITPYVSGSGLNGVGGDPSPLTAYGVFLGLQRAVFHRLNRSHLYGVRVAVQGLGSVGMSLCHWLARAGAELVVADIDKNRVTQAVRKYDAQAVPVSEITQVETDVFAPCALGGVLNEDFVRDARCRVVAGAANNQLASVDIAEGLATQDILYAPDFVINAGGVISVAHEYMRNQGRFQDDPNHDSESWVNTRIKAIDARLQTILERAEADGASTNAVAEAMALDVIASSRLDAAEAA